MTKLLLPDKTEMAWRYSQNIAEDSVATPSEHITLDHSCLVTEYMGYMAVAGYSVTPQSVVTRGRGAWSFLAKFPDPRVWLSLPVNEQLRCPPRERNFMHYLFLRRLLPMPASYILVAGAHLADMGRRLMERETYQRYHRMACRLGYRESGVGRQFQGLVCLMAWSQKHMDALTLADLDAFDDDLKSAYRQLDGKWQRKGLPKDWYSRVRGLRSVLYHLGILPQMTRNGRSGSTFEKRWQQIPPDISSTVRRYLKQLALSFRPGTVRMEQFRLHRFFSWLSDSMTEVTAVNQIKRRHIEAFKEHLRWAPPHSRFHRPPGATLCPGTRYKTLATLYYFFLRLTEWQWPEAPDRPLMFYQDLPSQDQPLPRFLCEIEAARFLQAARNHPDLFTRVCSITLMLTGLRQGEFLDLTTDCMVQIGDSYWLRVPLGKTHRERFIPLHPEVKELLDEWNVQHPHQKPYDFLFTMYGRRIGRGKVAAAVERIARDAGILGKVTPHRLRHTLATLAINRGMPLESIAALLGHRSLSMTMVYARIGDRTVQQEYASVTQRLEQLCDQSGSPVDEKNGPAIPVAEGEQMRRLRQDHWRMLGNGYCTRPEGVPCEYETICESCPCFSTTVDFLPILHKQRGDAEDKGQTQRAQIFGQLIQRMESDQ